MSLSSLSIERPVLTIVLSIVILIFGGIGFYYLGVREYPSVDPPIITVTTNYPGANAEVIESQITQPLEESISGIAGIRSISSISSDGRSSISVEFELEMDLEAAANDVRDRVSRGIRLLPRDADPPIVIKSDADATPIMSITVQSTKRSLLDLSRIANDVFKERLQTVAGVSEIRIWGEKKYSMKLLLDPIKLAGYGLTPLDVRNALLKENVELPSGRIEGYETELTIRTLGRLTTEDEFNDLIIRESDNNIIRLKDVGRAELLPENERTQLRGNGGVPMVGVAISPQAGSNHIAIADLVYERLEQIKKDLPDDIVLGMAMDTTVGIRKAIDEVFETILIAFALVVLVIFFFLRHWRTTLIPVLAIPISLIGSFFIMYLFDFSINILTLLGIVLATGIVVDDAIVVLENIYSKIEKGIPPLEAAHKGSKEIFFAIISTTITLISVFMPIIFLQGITGRLFREFGLVVAGAILISSFVSLSLTPMISSRLLKKSEKQGRFFDWTERQFEIVTNIYAISLNWLLNHRFVALIIMLVSISLIFIVGRTIQSELAPLEDKGRLQILATAPEGTSYESMYDYLTEIIMLVDSIPEKVALLSVTAPGFGASVSVNFGFVRVVLSPPEERERTQQQIADELSRQLSKYTFARAFVTQEATIGGGRGGGLPIQYVLQASNFEKLKSAVPEFLEAAGKSPFFRVVDINLKFNKPELRIEIDRDRARALGVTVQDIAETLQLFFSGQRFGYFIMNNKQYQVIGQADRTARDEPLDMSSIYVRNNKGELIQLDNLVNTSYHIAPPQLYRFNRYVSATISAAPASGFTLGQGLQEMDRIAAEVLDETFTTELAGESKEFATSSNTLLFAFILALILVFLVLSAQFESFRDPLIIMFTVPLAITGAVLSLWLTGTTLNIFSEIGIIILVGIVTKNGILIVEFANQKKAAGMTIYEAVFEAAKQRFRPILMTSLATVFGALPIAFALGSASQSRTPIGIVIIGGLLFSLVLTLYIIPVLYSLLSKRLSEN